MVMSSKKIGKMAGANVDKALASISASVKPDMKDDTLKNAVAPKKAQTFGEAFKAARKDPNSKGTFTWGGKSYSTNTASEGLKRPTSAPTRAPASKATSSDSPIGNYYRSQLARDKVSGAASNIKGVSAAESATAQKKAGKSNTTSTSAPPARKSPVNAGRSEGFGSGLFKAIKDFNDRGLKKDAEAAEKYKERQKKKYGYAKGGPIDGCAIRGKTRAPMKKGK
jgi:hypothetical protein